MTLLQRLRDRFQKRAKSAIQSYAELVQDAAASPNPEPSDSDLRKIENVLAAADRTPEQFQADVELLTRKAELEAASSNLPELEQAHAQLKRDRVRRDAEIDREIAALRAEAHELEAQQAASFAAVTRAREAAAQAAGLGNEWRDRVAPGTGARLGRAQAAAQADLDRVNEARKRLAAAEAGLANTAKGDELGLDLNGQAVEIARATVARAEAALAERRAQLAAAEAQAEEVLA